METKADIRKVILQNRNKLSEQELINKSKAICNQLLNTSQYKRASAIYIYMDFRNEVMTKQIIDDAFKAGKKVALPKVEGDAMNFYYMKDYDDLQSGCLGILEPNTFNPADDDNAFMIVPGVAFDTKGYRVGYGKGYYDKFLSRHRGFTKVAIAFELQLVDQIPYEQHDITVDRIITEEREILCQNY